jgi:hypothetical protein
MGTATDEPALRTPDVTQVAQPDVADLTHDTADRLLSPVGVPQPVLRKQRQALQG